MARASRVTVVGGGVIGLTCALALARAGHRVEVRTADPVGDTTSAVAAAVWFPYRAAPADAVLRWAADVAGRLRRPRRRPVDRRHAAPGHRRPPHARAGPLVGALGRRAPPGDGRRAAARDASAGTRCTLPVVHMGRYLPWLLDACRAAGVDRRPGSGRPARRRARRRRRGGRRARLGGAARRRQLVPGAGAGRPAGRSRADRLGARRGQPRRPHLRRAPRERRRRAAARPSRARPAPSPTRTSRRRCWSGPARSSRSSRGARVLSRAVGLRPGRPDRAARPHAASTGGRSSPATATAAPASPSRGAAPGTSPRWSGVKRVQAHSSPEPGLGALHLRREGTQPASACSAIRA